MGRKKKVEEFSEPVAVPEVPRVRLVRPEAYVEIRDRSEFGGTVQLRADGRVDINCGYSSRAVYQTAPTVTTGDLREALALLDAAQLVRQ